MIETRALLQECADFLRHLSGAGSVTIFVPGTSEAGPGCCLRVGEGPVPELGDPDTANRLESSFAAGEIDGVRDPRAASIEIASSDPDSVLYRIPAGAPNPRRGAAEGPERRRLAAGGVRTGVPLWVGLRFRPTVPDETGDADGPPVRKDWQGSDSWRRALLHASSVVTHGLGVAGALEDPLTGLRGRTGLGAALGLALEESRQGGTPLGLMLVNPDHFAEVNERHGRTCGDRVLREIADRVRRAVRTTDGVARYGAATFAVILAEAAPEDALQTAEKIRQNLGDQSFLDGAVRLRLSIGLVCIAPEDIAEEADASEWIHRAEQALSQARREGGDHTRAWSPDLAEAPRDAVDRLQGLFTGDLNRDYRNMAVLWEAVHTIATSTDTHELAGRIVSRLNAWMPLRLVAVLERSPGGVPKVVAARVEGAEPAGGWSLPGEQGAVVAELFGHEAGDHREIAPDGPGCAIPLDAGDRRIGCLYLETYRGDSVPAPDLRFLEALASQVAIALDRSRLNEAERERSEEEKKVLVSEVRELRRVFQAGRLAYCSEPMQALMDHVRRVAPTEATVLITGESGAGKEILAQTVHQLGERRDRPLVVVDCGAISASLIDSELFGHEKGSFTGAGARKKGRLVEADKATVFLDEIGELPIDVQSKLLRFVQEKTVMPVGGTKPLRVDVRIIAATNVDLATKVEQGTFREDLYHRLNVVHLRMPPLRDRPDDIPHLANLFVQQYATLYRKDGLRLTDEAVELLRTHRWPGNVRELQNRVMRAVLFADDDRIRAGDLPDLDGPPATDGVLSKATGDPAAASAERPGAPGAPPGDRTFSDRRARIRRLLVGEINRSLREVGGGRPLGKWLESDLVMAADRVAGSVARKGAALLGLPDTTFRRRLAKARRTRRAGLDQRTDTWDEVVRAIESLLSASEDHPGDLAAVLENELLEVVHERSPDVDTGAAFLGVTSTTYLRRLNGRRSSAAREAV